MIMLIFVLILLNLSGFSCFECPSLPSNGYVGLKTKEKCLAFRKLESSKRTKRDAAMVCESELVNGQLADLESEHLAEINMLISSYFNTYSPNMNIQFDHNMFTGFFIDYSTNQLSDGFKFFWPSGMPMKDVVGERELSLALLVKK